MDGLIDEFMVIVGGKINLKPIMLLIQFDLLFPPRCNKNNVSLPSHEILAIFLSLRGLRE